MSEKEMLIRIGVILLLSAVVGIDRELKHKPAGIKTHMLVGLGSTIFTLVSLSMFYMFKDEAQIDPGRIAAQIVTGIGFLGAGTIIQSRGTVTGLSTAASLWAVAGIGLATGMGMYLVAGVSTIAIVFIFIITNRIADMLGIGIDEVEEKIKKLENKVKKTGKKRG
ncbi:MAG: magnesium transporter MgtC [Candidatus Goldiibacteriota bacterium HGW-Goldbacteria-1]|jgi:putative Mg2+ transporter-C (MgtC) family protein|nr:MAG: magnesium transporter MgtC [Candidatus Goldiibacteriota bacterium HGW-Goldbacteria-1]